VWAAVALLAGRNIAIFALVSAPILVRYATLALRQQLEAWRSVGRIERWLGEAARPLAGGRLLGILNWLLLSVVVLAALLKIYLPLQPGAVEKPMRESLPVDAVAAIRTQRPAGPLFNSYNWGGYLIFALWPDYPVFVDGRTDLYDEAFLRDYLKTYGAEDGWQAQLDRYNIRLVIIEADSVLARFLRLESGWKEMFRDDMAAVFVRGD